jgi:malate/lactate dehydrogenase
VHVAGEGHAVACTCLIRGGAHEIELEDIQAEKTRAQGLNPDQGLQFVPEVTVTSSDDIAVTAEADIVVVTAGAKQPRQTARRSRTRSNAEETASTGRGCVPSPRRVLGGGVDGRDPLPAGGPSCRANHTNSATQTHPA